MQYINYPKGERDALFNIIKGFDDHTTMIFVSRLYGALEHTEAFGIMREIAVSIEEDNR